MWLEFHHAGSKVGSYSPVPVPVIWRVPLNINYAVDPVALWKVISNQEFKGRRNFTVISL
jgi:hypothetical protein